MQHDRGITIYFLDGTKLSVGFPVQTPNEMAALLRLEEIIKERQIIVEAEGAVLIIPFESIKYIQGYPAPAKLPRYAIQGATVTN